MAYPAIPSMTERNYVGLCHIDWVDVQDIATWPDEISGNLVGDIVLVEGAVWNRVELEDDTGALFNERWQLLGGAQHSVASITGDVAKDRLSLMPHLWRMKGRRCVARMTTRNGDVLILGTKLEPAVALVKRRTAGQDVDSDRNQYSVEIGVSRRVPVPFYQGVVEEPPTDPGECPTVGELVAPLSWTEIEALLDEDQLADAQASICETPPAPVLCDVIEAALAGSGPAGITLTSGANEDFLPQTGTISGKPVYFLVNFDGTGFSAEATWTGTEWYLTDGVNEWTSAEDVATPGDVVTWTGDTPLPTVVTSGPVSPAILLDCLTTEQNDELFGEMVDAREWAEIEAELDGTQLAAASVTIQLKDSAATNIGAPDVYPPGTSTNKTAPDGTIRTTDGLNDIATVKSNGATNLPKSEIEILDASGGQNFLAESNTKWSGSYIRPALVVPRVTIYERDGVTVQGYAGVDNPFYTVDACPACPVVTKFIWQAGDADTYLWTVTADEAGTYGTYTPTGTNGTLTYSKNGGGYAALSGAITLAVSDTITVRRTTTTNAGSVKWEA